MNRANAIMTRHRQAQLKNFGMAFRNGLLEALPELRRDLIEIYSELDGAGEPPLRNELVQVITDRITAFIKSNQAGQHGAHAASTAHTAMNLMSTYSMGVGRDLDLAVHARGKRTTGTTMAPPVTVVLLSVNPEAGEEEQQLAVDVEHAQIVRVRDGSKHQTRVRIEPLPDANFTGLAKSLRLHQPAMLHVTGHGRPDGSIVLRDEEGQAYPMNADGLAKLLCLSKATLQLVVLNTCYSQALADLLVAEIDCVVGMSSAIDDDAAILFSEAFYDALFDGTTVREAFETGVAALMARHSAEAEYPCLRCREGVDAGTVRLL